jgi:predicted  nucleic acid-binding Zn-ribbon protein
MKNVTENLMALQDLQGKAQERCRIVRSDLRLAHPDSESFLNTFDRFAPATKPVSIVRNGVCSECHLQIAVGILGSLAFGQGVQQCGNCGRFLYLPEDESVFAPEPSPNSKGVRSRKEAAAHVA